MSVPETTAPCRALIYFCVQHCNRCDVRLTIAMVRARLPKRPLQQWPCIRPINMKVRLGKVTSLTKLVANLYSLYKFPSLEGERREERGDEETKWQLWTLLCSSFFWLWWCWWWWWCCCWWWWWWCWWFFSLSVSWWVRGNGSVSQTPRSKTLFFCHCLPMSNRSMRVISNCKFIFKFYFRIYLKTVVERQVPGMSNLNALGDRPLQTYLRD